MYSKLIAIATSSTLSLIAATAIASDTNPYRTGTNELVVPGLQPRQTYLIQGTDKDGKESSVYIRTNECGYALINNIQNYDRLTINSRTIRPVALSTQSFPSCNPRWNPNQNQNNRQN